MEFLNLLPSIYVTRRHKRALEKAIEHILDTYQQTLAIFLYGNNMELESDENDDLNFYIVHTDSYSQHTRISLDGVNCNLWVNNLKQTYGYIQLEPFNKKSNMAVIIARGRIVHGLMNPGILALVNRAKKTVGSNLQ